MSQITPEPPSENTSDSLPPPDARTWGMLAHLAGFAGYVIPFGHILGPLIVWQMKKDTYEFVNDQGKESLNFQITCVIAILISIPLIFVCIGAILIPLICALDTVFTIIAAIKANEGVKYRYPWSLKLVK